MKTPDEIKKALKCCATLHGCNECPYHGEKCVSTSTEDTLAYIQQLERERDAAVADLAENRRCETCKHYTPGYFCVGCRCGDKWKWRGVQEVE